MTRFSVIVPLFNKAAFVGDCLRSILTQSHPHFEVIVVDDGSTDGSAEVVRAFDDDRIRIVTQSNQGVSAAKNRGIEAARHELLAFLDADDWWDRDYLQEMAVAVESHPDHSLYCAAYARVEHGIAEPNKPTFATRGQHTVFDPIEESVRAGTFVMPLHTSSTVIRKSILSRTGPFDPAIGYYEDYDLFLRAAAFSRCVRVNGRPLAFYLKDVPAAQRATGRLPAIERSLVGHLRKFDAFIPFHPALRDYVDTFRLFNLMAYVEAGVPAAVIRTLLEPTDPRRFSWRHRIYYSFSPLGKVLVRLNMFRRGLAARAAAVSRGLRGHGGRHARRVDDDTATSGVPTTASVTAGIMADLRWTRRMAMPWEVAVLAFPLATIFTAAAGFLVGLPVAGWQVACGLATSVLLCLPGPGSWRRKVRKVAVVLLVILASVILAGMSVMYSNVDAEHYHRPASMLMAGGWNPVFDSTMKAVDSLRDPGFAMRVWHVAYLPRASWIFGAELYRTVGFVEAADSLNILAYVVSLFVVSRLLARLFRPTVTVRRMATALLATSPVVAALTFGGSSDGALYSLFLSAAAAATLYLMTGGRRWLALVTVAFPLLANLKFTGSLCCGVISLVYLFACLRESWRGRPRSSLASRWSLAVAASAALAGVIGFSPYITSWVHHGSPLYPEHTFDRRLNLTHNPITADFLPMNDDARSMGRIGRLSYSYLSRNLTLACYSRLMRKPDFSPRFDINGGVEGFGPFFRGVFILSLISLPFANVGRLGYALACILVTVAAQPTLYIGYARYVPQLYAFPPLVLLALAYRLRVDPHMLPQMGKTAAVTLQKWAEPLTVAILAGVYALPLLAYPLSFAALQWIISVQNLEIVTAMRNDPHPIVLATTHYARHSLQDDYDCRNVRFFRREADLPEETARLHRYGPYFSSYAYFSPRKLEGFPSLAHVVSANDETIIASRNRRNIEYFLREFLPAQIVRFPAYLLDVLKLRCRQVAHAWNPTDPPCGGGCR